MSDVDSWSEKLYVKRQLVLIIGLYVFRTSFAVAREWIKTPKDTKSRKPKKGRAISRLLRFLTLDDMKGNTFAWP